LGRVSGCGHPPLFVWPGIPLLELAVMTGAVEAPFAVWPALPIRQTRHVSEIWLEGDDGNRATNGDSRADWRRDLSSWQPWAAVPSPVMMANHAKRWRAGNRGRPCTGSPS